jgi:F-type H+-transporting ATPase subunit b
VNVTLTLIGQMGTFAVLVWFVMKFLWTPILKVMGDRETRIADGLAAAERGQHEKELAEKAAVEHLREAKEQAKDIITQANKRAEEIVDGAKNDGRDEGERMKTAAQADIEQQTNQAREALRADVVRLALVGAERILTTEVDADAHNAALQKLAAEL